jgi:hypothetical protein
MPDAKTPATNVEFVADIMEYSRFGPVAQLFVIQALLHYSTAVLNAKPESLAAMDEGMIPGAVWRATAADIHKRVNDRLGE